MKKLYKEKKYKFSNIYGSNIPMYIVLGISIVVTALLILIGFFSIDRKSVV